MMTELTEGKGAGKWQRVCHDEFGERPRWSAIVWCPVCSRPLSISNHSIAEDGQVAPVVGHPDSYEPCTWKVAPRLVGWVSMPDPEPKPILATCALCGAKARQLGCWGTWPGGLVCPKCIEGGAYWPGSDH